MKHKLFTLFLALFFYGMLVAQVTTTPAIIGQGYTGQVTITFDPSKGNGGMVGATKCYAHTGLITSESTSTSDWKNVLSSWRSADAPELNRKGDVWELVIPNIYTFYNVPETTEIIALAMVFNDGPNGTKEGKSSSGSGDILIYLGEETTADIWDGFVPAPVVEQARPDGIVNGIYYDVNGTSVTLCTYAASKTEPANHVFLIGDMNNWQLDNTYQLKRDGDYFWITLNDLEPGKEYRFQYAVERADGIKKQISELFSEKVIHPYDQYIPNLQDTLLYPERVADGDYVSVIQTQKPSFAWSDETLNFQRPDKNNLIIYELWVYDYTAIRTLEGLMERLDYLENLGVNAVELMPVCEFDGNNSWGYGVNHYFALDKAYGTPDQFKRFIDECHKRGIAVIMDMVFNHATGSNPMNKLYPYGSDLAQNPWFNVMAPHSDNYYDDWNHDFAPAKDMFTRVLKYWLQEYKVDGYRMELSHGICGTTNNAVQNLKYYYNTGVKSVSPDAYFICEHWGNNMFSDRQQLVNEGMLCWENTNIAYMQTAMGWLQDGDGFSNANKDGYVSYCESHDEERMQYKAKQWGNGDVKTNDSIRLARVAENVAFNVLLNGSHLMWQYEEIGYDYSIYSDADNKDAYEDSYRANIKPRPENLKMFQDPNRMAAFTKCAQIIQLRTRLLPSVFAGNPTNANLASGRKVRSIQWDDDVFVVANFDAQDAQTATLPDGSWYDYLDGGSLAQSSVTLACGEVKIYTGSPLAAPTIMSDYTFALDSTRIEYQLTTQSSDENMGYTTGDCMARVNSNITISAVPNTGYRFARWSDDNTDNPRTVILTQDTTFTAIFEEDICTIASGTCGAQGDNLTWTLTCDSVLTISGTGAMADYNNADNMPAPWFQYHTFIQSVIIEDGITSIGFEAFWECDNLQSVDIPNSVVNIEAGAFCNCYNLESVTIPSSVTNIGTFAFYNCHRLTSITIPSSVATLGRSPFGSCINVPSIEVANDNPNYCSVDGVLFNKQQTILIQYPAGKANSTYTIPSSVTDIQYCAFSSCNWLNTITIGNHVTNIDAQAFYGCSGLTSMVIPNSITKIGDHTFYNCTSLISVTIPSSVMSIGEGAFAYCRSLTSVTNYATEPQVIVPITFYYINLSSCTLYVPAQSVAAYQAADVWKEFGTILPIEGELPIEPTEGEFNVLYVGQDGDSISSEAVMLHLPVAPEIAGFTFLKWQVVAGDLENGIIIQAVYQANEYTSAPEVYTNPANPAQKLIRNGNVYILTDDKIYSITGQTVR